PGISPNAEMGQATIDMGPGQVGTQRDPGAVAGDGRGELSQPDVTVAEQEIIGEVLHVAPRDLLERGQDLATLPDRRGVAQGRAAIDPVENVPVAVRGGARRDGFRVLP